MRANKLGTFINNYFINDGLINIIIIICIHIIHIAAIDVN